MGRLSKYWFIDFDDEYHLVAHTCSDVGSAVDEDRYLSGNYFETEQQCENLIACIYEDSEQGMDSLPIDDDYSSDNYYDFY